MAAHIASCVSQDGSRPLGCHHPLHALAVTLPFKKIVLNFLCVSGDGSQLPYMHAVPMEARRGHHIPETGVRDVCEPPRV